ncbi:MAG: hypothetical protein IPP47_30840 [Bryobacterales bacterium]|nr:hypothetical protein [Bryobacterales bacterium]
MLPNFLLPDQVVRQNGSGPAIDLGEQAGGVLAVTLGVNRIIEQESLDVSIWGSVDGQVWSDKPIAAFPQKFYCGTYSLLVDLTDQPDVRYLRADWKMNRWGRGEPTPLFGLYVFAEVVKQGVLQATH